MSLLKQFISIVALWLRGSMLDNPEEIVEMNLSVEMISAILRKAA